MSSLNPPVFNCNAFFCLCITGAFEKGLDGNPLGCCRVLLKTLFTGDEVFCLLSSWASENAWWGGWRFWRLMSRLSKALPQYKPFSDLTKDWSLPWRTTTLCSRRYCQRLSSTHDYLIQHPLEDYDTRQITMKMRAKEEAHVGNTLSHSNGHHTRYMISWSCSLASLWPLIPILRPPQEISKGFMTMIYELRSINLIAYVKLIWHQKVRTGLGSLWTKWIWKAMQTSDDHYGKMLSEVCQPWQKMCSG